MKKEDITRDQWVAKIAIKSGRDIVEIDKLFSHLRIEPRLERPIPRRLLIESLAFYGEKTGDYENKSISFARSGMKPGIHAFVSQDNFKGKTTLFKTIRWLLTGTYDLPPDMAGWLHTALLEFRIDEQKYEIKLDNVISSQGSLSSFARGKARVIANFSDADSFKSVMDGFFLNALKLEPLIAVANVGDGIEQRHGWNWLSTAMVIDPAPEVLFGTDTNHGKPLRMMQMYLGVPWVLTRADLMAAKKRLEIENHRTEKANKEIILATEQRLAELRTIRDSLEAKSKAEKSVADLKRKASEALNAFVKATSDVRKLTPILNEATEELAAAEIAVSQSMREWRQFQENVAAGRIFRALRPVCCPSCEEVYTDAYRQLKESNHDCVVCGREDTRESDPNGDEEETFKQAIEDAKVEKTRRRRHLSAVEQKMNAAITERDNQDKLNRGIEAEIDKLRADESAEIKVIRINAQIAELERMVTESAETSSPEIKILEDAINVTRTLYDEEQDEVLGAVSSLIADFARSFGMTDLERVNLKGNATMDVFMKGGNKTFKACTNGERMRLKTAATLALIQVSEERGIGNHPGVLFVDSVGNNEAIDKNVAEIVSGLAKLQESLPDVQVFVGGITSPAILDLVPSNNVLKNRSDGYLW